MAHPTFTCKDCGCSVYDALGCVRERCRPCQWVADIPDPVERQKIKEWLTELGVITNNHDNDNRKGH